MEAFQVNPNIILALNMLQEAGFDAYIVGGAVRDFILDLPVSDYDIAITRYIYYFYCYLKAFNKKTGLPCFLYRSLDLTLIFM